MSAPLSPTIEQLRAEHTSVVALLREMRDLSVDSSELEKGKCKADATRPPLSPTARRLHSIQKSFLEGKITTTQKFSMKSDMLRSLNESKGHPSSPTSSMSSSSSSKKQATMDDAVVVTHEITTTIGGEHLSPIDRQLVPLSSRERRNSKQIDEKHFAVEVSPVTSSSVKEKEPAAAGGASEDVEADGIVFVDRALSATSAKALTARSLDDTIDSLEDTLKIEDAMDLVQYKCIHGSPGSVSSRKMPSTARLIQEGTSTPVCLASSMDASLDVAVEDRTDMIKSPPSSTMTPNRVDTRNIGEPVAYEIHDEVVEDETVHDVEIESDADDCEGSISYERILDSPGSPIRRNRDWKPIPIVRMYRTDDERGNVPMQVRGVGSVRGGKEEREKKKNDRGWSDENGSEVSSDSFAGYDSYDEDAFEEDDE
eukprot:g3547.t1